MHTELKTPLLEWQAPSRITHQRGRAWYACAAVAVFGMVVYGVLTGAWTFAITIAILAGLFYLVRNEPHPIHSVRIMELGVEFDGVLHPWNDWKDFWMLTSPDHCELHFEHKKALRADLVVHTGTMNPLTVRDTIAHYLPQNPNKREKMLDAIIRFCKL